MEELTACTNCGEMFPSRGNKIYCGLTCRESAKFRKTDRVPCSICGGPTGYKAGRVEAATCNPCRSATWQHGTAKGYRDKGCRCDNCKKWSTDSHADYVYRRTSGQIDAPVCVEQGCKNIAWAREMCRMHYKRWHRASGMDKAPSSAWSDTRRSNWHARRVRAGSSSKSSDKVLIAELIAAGDTICAWCSQPIDITLTYPDKWSKSLDHTVPLSKGGTHTLDNTSLMHLTCNVSKGARLMSTKE